MRLVKRTECGVKMPLLRPSSQMMRPTNKSQMSTCGHSSLTKFWYVIMLTIARCGPSSVGKPAGSKTLANSRMGAVPCGCEADMKTMARCTSENAISGPHEPITFFVTSQFGATIMRSQKGCGTKVATENKVLMSAFDPRFMDVRGRSAGSGAKAALDINIHVVIITLMPPAVIDLTGDDPPPKRQSSGELPPRKKRRGSVAIVVGGDIRKCEEPALAHQCNCVSKRARGLAKALFEQWPEADVYRTRRGPSTPGTIEARGVGGLVVVALFAQKTPGKPWAPDDRPGRRLEYFERCLVRLGRFMQDRRLTAVAMPYNIGCGLANGDWALYSAKIDAFVDTFGVHVKLYDFERQSSQAMR